jgi:HAE1 family hydrophobic/amphiphilic exporter-1
MSITNTSIRRPVATAMVYLIVITLGTLGFRYLPVDLLPPIEFPRITVNTGYPNVGPEEIELLLTDRIENAIAGVPNIQRITSNSEEGRSNVTAHFAQGTNLEEAANDIRGAIDRLRGSFPPEVEQPRIWKFDPNNAPIVMIGASSNRNLADLTKILQRDISKRFEQIPGVGSIDVWGGMSREVQVNLQRDRMITTGVTANEITQALSRENANLPGGNIKDGYNDIYVRTLGEFETVDQIANTVIKTVDGRPIRVRDIAFVAEGYSTMNRLVKIEDRTMVRFAIRKQTGANTVAVAQAIRNEVDRVNAERPDLQLVVTTDQSNFIQSSIDNVRNSAVWGAVLAIIILMAFLRNGSTVFVIAIAIPISIIATFALLYFNGLTLNQMSFGGLALGVGMIVDNAIVVLENIVRLRQGGGKPQESAAEGTRQVAGAIVASTLTTSVVFLPVVFIQSITGILFQQLALVVVFSLICSLFVALTLVPMLASRFLTIKPVDPDSPEAKKHGRIYRNVEAIYAKSIQKVLTRRTLVISMTAVLLVVSTAGLSLIPMELAPQSDADAITVSMRMASGTNMAVVQEYTKELEHIVDSVVPRERLKFMSTDVREGRGEIELTLDLNVPSSETPSQLADRIRSRVDGVIPGAQVNVSAQSGLWILRRVFGNSGEDASVQVELRGYDLSTSDALAQDLKRQIEELPGIASVNISRSEGRPEQNLRFDREKLAELGLSVRAVAQTLQTSIGGSQAGVYRVAGDEYPIRVRLQEKDRMSYLDLDNIAISTPVGVVLPVSALLDKSDDRGPTAISRVNGQRVTYINATLESGLPLGDAVQRIRGELSQTVLPEGFSIVFGGEYEEQQKAAADFQLAIIIALVLIYMVMAAQFERFIDPLIVMCSVPLALIGVVPTMLLTGTTLNLQSLMGIVMLVGIVVNNAIVLVDYINLLRREEGLGVHEAVVKAARLRLRPILMTTLTTVLGLLPMSFGLGQGGEIQASLARVVIGGLTASTLITLVLIPTVYVIVASLQERFYAWVATRQTVVTATETTRL